MTQLLDTTQSLLMTRWAEVAATTLVGIGVILVACALARIARALEVRNEKK